MQLLERDVFFFTTFGGEALSLAAAKATMRELRDRRRARRTSSALGAGCATATTRSPTSWACRSPAASASTAARMVTFARHAGWRRGADPLVMKSFVQQELIKRGVLWSGFHNLSCAHTDADVAHAARRLPRGAAAPARGASRQGDVRGALRGEPVEPVFRKHRATST